MRVLWEPKISTIEQIRELVDEHDQAYFAVGTTWWTIRSADVATKGPDRRGLPCDPRGSVLMQGPASDFLDAAEQHPEHYGPLGLVAFCASFHGNLVLPDRRPWSLQSWDLVTAVIRQSVWQANLVLAASAYDEVAPDPLVDVISELERAGAW